ncbi:MAG: hypothetical protein K8R77_14850 [Anaerolineaceae bacterium]|nr:hypothetical protein [Anaerolineaceae bacterium]
MDAQDVKTLTLLIKSPAGILHEQAGLRSLQVELSDGKIGIHAGHAPLIAEVADGVVALDDGQSIKDLPIHAGIVVVQDDLVKIYTHSHGTQHEFDVSASNSVHEDREESFDQLYDAIISTLTQGAEKDNITDAA